MFHVLPMQNIYSPQGERIFSPGRMYILHGENTKLILTNIRNQQDKVKSLREYRAKIRPSIFFACHSILRITEEQKKQVLRTQRRQDTEDKFSPLYLGVCIIYSINLLAQPPYPSFCTNSGFVSISRCGIGNKS